MSARPVCGTAPAPELLEELLPEELPLEEVAPEDPLLDEAPLELAPEELLLEDEVPEELPLDTPPPELLELLELLGLPELLDDDPPLLVDDPPVPGALPPGLLVVVAVEDEEPALELSLQAASVASSAHSAIRVKIPCPITQCPRPNGRYNAENSHHVHRVERVSPEVIARLREAMLAAHSVCRHGPHQLATARLSPAVPHAVALRPTFGAGI